MSNGCDHLTDKGGPKDKIVRLPENCGQGPFVRVVDLWVHDDQSVPPNVEAKLSRRHDSIPAVHGMRLDTNFSAIDSTRFGAVNFSISASSATNHNATSKRQTGPFSQQGVSFPAVTEAPFLEFMSFMSTTIRCTGLDPDPFFRELQGIFDVSNVDIAMDVLIGVQGNMVPPTISSFIMTTGFSLDLSATLLAGDIAVTGQTGSSRIRATETSLPGFSFPGILDIRPSFFVDLSFIAEMQIGITTMLGLEYHINNGVFTFPPSKGVSSATISPGDFQVQYAVGTSRPSSKALVSRLNYDLIPGINFGLSAFGGAVTSAIVLSLDAGAETTMELQASTTDLIPVFDANYGMRASATATSGFFSVFAGGTTVTVGSQAFFISTLENDLSAPKRDVTRIKPRAALKKKGQEVDSLSCEEFPPAPHTVFDTTLPSSSLIPCGTVQDCF
ncbi:hypothetical protein HGRIS_012272 [Hohenbuehelia grisea]